MQDASIEEDRNVIPRWRAPRAADAWEIEAARDLGSAPFLKEAFADQIALWREEGSLAASVDIYDAGILLGDKPLQMEGAGPILANADRMPPALLDDVRRSMARSVGLRSRREQLARLESSDAYLRQTIRLLKKRLNDHPRDVLSLMEASRLHVLLGQIDVAERYVRRAIALAPNDRLTLRSATQYYNLAGTLPLVLPHLRDSEAAPYDPLIQSAEVAVANLTGRGSRFALSALKGMRGTRQVGLRRSELALAVATLERDAGLSQRRVFQLVRSGLAVSTENAQAQAVWLGEQADRPLRSMLPGLDLDENAYEARALALFDSEDYAGAARAARSWLADQPFEPDPAAVVCNCHSIYLRTAHLALPVADRATALHPGVWAVQNAALLVYIASGRMDRAEAVLRTLQRLASSPMIEAFALAGAGMLAFARNRLDEGQESYEAAIHAARKAQRPDLAFSAYVFWILGEAKAGTLSRSAFGDISEGIARIMKRLPASNRSDADKLWRAVGPQADAAAPDDLPAVATAGALVRMTRDLPDSISD